MLDVVIRVRPASSWLTDFAAKFDTMVTIHDCAPFGNDGAQGLIEIDTGSIDADEMIKELLSHPDVSGVHLAHDKDRRVMVSVTAKEWVACSTILRGDCYLRDANVFPDGRVEWRLFTPRAATLRAIVMDLTEVGCQVELVKKRRAESADRLTDKQLMVVRKALELGYFDHPRRITVRELARRLKIAPSTLSETLRRAGRKMAEFYLRKGQV